MFGYIPCKVIPPEQSIGEKSNKTLRGSVKPIVNIIEMPCMFDLIPERPSMSTDEQNLEEEEDKYNFRIRVVFPENVEQTGEYAYQLDKHVLHLNGKYVQLDLVESEPEKKLLIKH